MSWVFFGLLVMVLGVVAFVALGVFMIKAAIFLGTVFISIIFVVLVVANMHSTGGSSGGNTFVGFVAVVLICVAALLAGMIRKKDGEEGERK